MWKITNMSHNRVDDEGRMNARTILVAGRPVPAGTSITVTGDLPPGARMMACSEEFPCGPLDVEYIEDVQPTPQPEPPAPEPPAPQEQAGEQAGVQEGVQAEEETPDAVEETPPGADTPPQADETDSGGDEAEDTEGSPDDGQSVQTPPPTPDTRSVDTTAREAIRAIRTMTDPAYIDAYIDGDTRKTVNEAAEDRKEDLAES